MNLARATFVITNQPHSHSKVKDPIQLQKNKKQKQSFHLSEAAILRCYLKAAVLKVFGKFPTNFFT